MVHYGVFAVLDSEASACHDAALGSYRPLQTA
jgi:hypothetical protein